MPLEAQGISELAATMGRIPMELRTELEPAVLEAGQLVADRAKSNASWSSYIPGAVTVTARFAASGGGAEIRVAERGYPHAGEVRTLEGNGDGPTEFRHRVYGNPNAFAPMQTRPFLHPALDEESAPATEVIAAAVSRIFTL